MIYDGAEMLVEAFQSFPTGKTKVKCTGMREKFNPLQESCQTACVRACAEELKASVSEEGAQLHVRCFRPRSAHAMNAACSTDFCEAPLLAKVDAGSRKFLGLRSEYHVRLHIQFCSYPPRRSSCPVDSWHMRWAAILLYDGSGDV